MRNKVIQIQIQIQLRVGNFVCTVKCFFFFFLCRQCLAFFFKNNHKKANYFVSLHTFETILVSQQLRWTTCPHRIGMKIESIGLEFLVSSHQYFSHSFGHMDK